MKRFFRSVLVASAFAFFWSGAALLAWVLLPPLALIGGSSVERTRRCQRFVSGSFRLFHGYMQVLRLVDARVTGEIPRPDGGPVVLVANHTTLVDVTAIIARFPNICCVAKSSYADNFFVGRLLRLCGFIPSEQRDPEGKSILETACERLRQGFDILVFPEGTRSPPDGLLPFRRGAFEIACRAGVPIVPLLLRCQPSALTKDRAFWDHPDKMASLTIEPQAPINPLDCNRNSRHLRQKIEAEYRAALNLPKVKT